MTHPPAHTVICFRMNTMLWGYFSNVEVSNTDDLNLGQCRCHNRDHSRAASGSPDDIPGLVKLKQSGQASSKLPEQSCGRREGSMYLNYTKNSQRAGMLTTSMRCSAPQQAPLLCSHCEPFFVLEEDIHPSESAAWRCFESDPDKCKNVGGTHWASAASLPTSVM